MAKRAENIFYSNGLLGVKNNVNKIVVCSAEPTTFTEANATFALGSVAATSTDFTEAAGDVSGRKLIVAAKTLTGSATGTGNHIALVNTGASTYYLATTCNSIGIVNGQPQNFSTWDIEISAPS